MIGGFSLVLGQDNGGGAMDGTAQEKDWGTQSTVVGLLIGDSEESLTVRSLGSTVRLLGLEFLFLCVTLQCFSPSPYPTPYSVV